MNTLYRMIAVICLMAIVTLISASTPYAGSRGRPWTPRFGIAAPILKFFYSCRFQLFFPARLQLYQKVEHVGQKM